jgi:hypothetical protein
MNWMHSLCAISEPAFCNCRSRGFGENAHPLPRTNSVDYLCHYRSVSVFRR